MPSTRSCRLPGRSACRTSSERLNESSCLSLCRSMPENRICSCVLPDYILFSGFFQRRAAGVGHRIGACRMNTALTRLRQKWVSPPWVRSMVLILSVFGPATIAAMADNDASGVATYSIAGATLGYPILFLLLIITVLLAMTQEMGMRLTLISRKGLADLIRGQ